MKLGTKLALGFGIVVVLMIALGTTGYVMFTRVNTNVTELSGHSLPSVKHSTGVERSAFETIMEEKNYLLLEKDEIHVKAKQKLADLMANLDAVDKVAEQYNDTALAAKSKEVRGIAKQYGELYEKGVASLKNNKGAEATMNAKGELVGNEASAYMAAKEKEYNEAKTALAIVNRINAAALDTRMNEKGYMIYKEQKYFDVIAKNITDLLSCYDQLEKLHPDATEQKQIADARKATQDYFEAAKSWVAKQKVSASEGDTLVAKGTLVTNEADAYLASKKAEYLEGKNALAIVNRINALALETRMNEKAYMIYKDAKYFTAIEKNIAALLGCYTDLEKLHPDSAEQKQITDARKSTQDYFEAAKSWVAEQKANDKSDKLEQLAKTMDETGNIVGKCAADYLSAKQARVDKIADAVFIVADIAQTAMDCRRLANRYMLKQDAKSWETLQANLVKLPKLYEDLRKVSLTADDQQRIEKADKATQEYAAIAKSWADNDNAMKAAAVSMDTGGQIVGKAAEDYLNAKQAMTEKVAASVFIVAGIADKANATRLNEKEYIIDQNPKVWASLNTNITALSKLYEDLRKVSLTAEDGQRIDRAAKATTEYLTAATGWVDNDKTLKQTILPQMATIGTTVIGNAQAAEGDAWKQSDQVSANVSSIVSSSKVITIFALIVGTLVGLVAAFVITRSITRAITRISGTLAAGAEQTTSAAGQVSASSQSLARGASEQAAALEETSSSLEEMSSMTKKNADSAQQASALSAEAKSAADKGNAAMQKMSDAINEIQKSAGETAKIIKVIDEIAFQTNLLALNAAVEAARAGEAGKGFAVVAEEVRNLAMRSAEAAKNTSSMIEESVNNARNGVAITQEVGKTLEEITSAATRVNALVGEISSASLEQTQGIDQVNKAVGQMDKVTQANAAGAEESAAAAEELSSQAEQVSSVVRELIALVSGQQGGSAGAETAARTPATAHAASAAAPTKHVTAKAASAKAAATIPLDEHEAAGRKADFSEFSKAA